jgi:hypothetical protein
MLSDGKIVYNSTSKNALQYFSDQGILFIK